MKQDFDSEDDETLIRTANTIQDQLSVCGIETGLATSSGRKFQFLSTKAVHISDARKFEIFSLLQTNMIELYEQAWGWDRENKWKEMFSPVSHYILVLDEEMADANLAAFLHYQVDCRRLTVSYVL